MRRIDEEKSKAIQSVFRDLISQVNKMNEVLVPCPPISTTVNNESPSKGDQIMFQSPSKSNNMGKENDGSSIKKSIGRSNNKPSVPAK